MSTTTYNMWHDVEAGACKGQSPERRGAYEKKRRHWVWQHTAALHSKPFCVQMPRWAAGQSTLCRGLAGRHRWHARTSQRRRNVHIAHTAAEW